MRLFEGTPWDRPPTCERCGQVESECECPPDVAATAEHKDPASQTARLTIERRKRSKQVIVIRGLAASDNDLGNLLLRIKSECGVGGTRKGDVLEVQGGQLDRVREVLVKLGYRCR